MATRRATSAGRGTEASFRPFFLLAAVYDGLLGAGFLFFAGPIYAALGAPPPADPVYLRLIAAFVAVQGLGYAFVWRDPARNAAVVAIGAVYKAAYVAVALLALGEGDLPHVAFAWFAATDALFLAGFLRFLRVAAVPGGAAVPGSTAGGA